MTNDADDARGPTVGELVVILVIVVFVGVVLLNRATQPQLEQRSYDMTPLGEFPASPMPSDDLDAPVTEPAEL